MLKKSYKIIFTYYIINVTPLLQQQNMKQTQTEGKHVFYLGAEEN